MKKPNDEPVLINTAGNAVAAVLAWLGYSGVVGSMAFDVIVYVLAGLLALGGTAWARRNVLPLYKFVQLFTDSSQGGSTRDTP